MEETELTHPYVHACIHAPFIHAAIHTSPVHPSNCAPNIHQSTHTSTMHFPMHQFLLSILVHKYCFIIFSTEHKSCEVSKIHGPFSMILLLGRKTGLPTGPGKSNSITQGALWTWKTEGPWFLYIPRGKDGWALPWRIRWSFTDRKWEVMVHVSEEMASLKPKERWTLGIQNRSLEKMGKGVKMKYGECTMGRRQQGASTQVKVKI